MRKDGGELSFGFFWWKLVMKDASLGQQWIPLEERVPIVG